MLLEITQVLQDLHLNEKCEKINQTLINEQLKEGGEDDTGWAFQISFGLGRN